MEFFISPGRRQVVFTVSGRVFAILLIPDLIIVEYVALVLEIPTQEMLTVNQCQVST